MPQEPKTCASSLSSLPVNSGVAKSIPSTPSSVLSVIYRSSSPSAQSVSTLDTDPGISSWVDAPVHDPLDPYSFPGGAWGITADKIPPRSADSQHTVTPGGRPPRLERSQQAVAVSTWPAETITDASLTESYIPYVLRKRAIADPRHCSLGGDPSWPTHPPWMENFRKGCGAGVHIVRQHFATSVVNRGPWQAKQLSELATKFVEHASDDLGETPSFNALFARQVYERFREVDPLPARLFKHFLMQAVFAEFRAYWVPAMNSSIINLPVCSPSPPHAPPIYHLSCALAITRYIGDLYRLGLAKETIIAECLKVLVGHMSTLEQLQATHSLILHCNSRLSPMFSLPSIYESIERRVRAMAPNVSAVGAIFGQSYVQLYLNDIRSMFQRWIDNPPVGGLEYPTTSLPNNTMRVAVPHPAPQHPGYFSPSPFTSQTQTPKQNGKREPAPRLFPPVPLAEHSIIAMYPDSMWGVAGLR